MAILGVGFQSFVYSKGMSTAVDYDSESNKMLLNSSKRHADSLSSNCRKRKMMNAQTASIKGKNQGICNSKPVILLTSGITHATRALAEAPCVDSIPNRKNTSEQVTAMEIRIRTMIIHVRRDILLSAMESDRISARSRKTRQRSLRTLMRGLISRYSRTA